MNIVQTIPLQKKSLGWRFFILPVSFFLLTFTVYAITAIRYVHPGLTQIDTAVAAGIAPIQGIAHPIYSLLTRIIAKIPFLELPLRLNLFCGFCAAVAVSLFFLLVVRIIFALTIETSDGAMHLDQQEYYSDKGSDSKQVSDQIEISKNVFLHNQFSFRSAILGGIGASIALAFSAPFWISATRLSPFAFDMMALFFLANIILKHDQTGSNSAFYLGAFLISFFWIESPVFLFFLPLSAIIFFRTILFNEKFLARRVSIAVALMSIGMIAAWFILWQVGARCDSLSNFGSKMLLSLYFQTIVTETWKLVPHSFNWIYSVVAFLVVVPPVLLLMFNSFSRRTLAHFIFQLILGIFIVINLLNLNFSLWQNNLDVNSPPVFCSVFLAFCCGLLISIWDIMGENRKISRLDKELLDLKKVKIQDDDDDNNDESDSDPRETQGNRVVCLIGSFLSIPLLVLTFLSPLFSYPDVSPKNAFFAKQVTDIISREIRQGDCLLNAMTTRYAIFLQKYMENTKIHSFSFSSTQGENSKNTKKQLDEIIQTNPLFLKDRSHLLNSTYISTSSFLRSCLEIDTNSYKRIVLFHDLSSFRKNKLTPIPARFFFRCIPSNVLVDSLKLFRDHMAFTEEIRPVVFPEEKDKIPFYREFRIIIGKQIAFIGNELGCLLFSQNHLHEADQIFQCMSVFDPDNLAILFNQFHLASKMGNLSLKKELQKKIKQVPRKIDVFELNEDTIATTVGTMIAPETLSLIRNRYWVPQGEFDKFLSAEERERKGKILDSFQNKKRDLHNLIQQDLDANEYDRASRTLNILYSIDSKDPFIAVQKARIAIQKENTAEAEKWLEMAKKSKVSPKDILWHEASILFLKGKRNEAKAMLNKAIPDHINNIYLWGLLAHILLSEENYYEVEKRVLPALRSAYVMRKHHLFQEIQGELYLHNGALISARNSFREALKLNRYLRSAREKILSIDDSLDILSFNEEDAKECLMIHPHHALANYLLGMVRYHNGEWDLARDFFQRSLKEKVSPAVLAGLGALSFEEGKLKDAEKLLRASYEKEPSRKFTACTLARLLLETERLEEAESILVPLLHAWPGDIAIQTVYLKLLIKQRKTDEAYALRKKLLPEGQHLPPIAKKRLEDLCYSMVSHLTEDSL